MFQNLVVLHSWLKILIRKRNSIVRINTQFYKHLTVDVSLGFGTELNNINK